MSNNGPTNTDEQWRICHRQRQPHDTRKGKQQQQREPMERATRKLGKREGCCLMFDQRAH